MLRFIKKLFPYGEIAKLQMTIETLQKERTFENEEQQKAIENLRTENSVLKHNLLACQNRNWTSVKKIDPNKVYYVVTQGSFYQIAGNRLLREACSEVTRRAFRTGFVVETSKEAYSLQEAIRDLVR